MYIVHKGTHQIWSNHRQR